MERINTKTDCAKFIASLAEAFGQEWSPARTQSYLFTYAEELQYCDLGRLKKLIMQGSDWMPKPKEFGILVKQIGPCKKNQAINDVNWVLTLCERHGEEFYDFASPYLAYVKDTLMSFKISQSDEDKEAVIQARFWDWVDSVKRYYENYNQWDTSRLPSPMPKEIFNHAIGSKKKVVPFKKQET